MIFALAGPVKNSKSATAHSIEYLKGESERVVIIWMKKAAEAAEETLCFKAKCGTVVVKDAEIIGVGYNAPALVPCIIYSKRGIE